MKKSLLFLFLGISLHSLASQPRKVLIIGIDGTRSDALQQANTPNLDSIVANGLYSWNSWHCGITVSAPSWSDIMCGVWEGKHGVTSNSYTNSNYNSYPYFVKRAKELKPDLYAVQVTEWAPMSDNVYNDGWDEKIKVPDGEGEPTEQAAITALQNPDLDALFVYFDAVDLTGHSSGFNPNNPNYIAAIEGVDSHIGPILNALRSRPNYASENWLILLTTDHGGIGTGHGGGSDEERQIWWMGCGSAVPHQELTGGDPGSYQLQYQILYGVSPVDQSILENTPVQTDIAVTALHHLIYDLGIRPENQPAWNLDGKSWLDKISGIPSVEQNNQLAIYPNPSEDIVTVWFQNDFGSQVNYSLMDMQGKAIPIHPVFESKSKLSFDVSSLPSGNYTMELTTNEKKFFGTIIKK
jgi:predicted AlkP superfamily pyrophosphatase or phosphodiesterase